MSTLNFPWIGRNPYKLGSSLVVLFGLLMLPSVFTSSAGRSSVRVFCEIGLPLAAGGCFTAAGLAVRLRLRRLGRLSQQRLPAAAFADCLLVHGAVQMPATIVTDSQQLVLLPLFGPVLVLPFEKLGELKPTRWFNGQYLFQEAGGFWLPPAGKRRLGIAVPDTAKFSEQLQSAKAATA